MPSLYASRPIEQIHVKVQPEGGGGHKPALFPQSTCGWIDGHSKERRDLLVGYFNFGVLQ